MFYLTHYIKWSFFKKELVINFILIFFLFLINNPLSATESAAEDTIERASEIGKSLTEEDKNVKGIGPDYYIGVLVEADELQDDQIIAEESTAKLGKLNLSVDDGNQFDALLIGEELRINGVPVEVKLDEVVGARKLNREGEPDDQWFVTARADVKKKFESATLFASGGLAIARLSSDTAVDFELEEQEYVKNPSDSDRIQLGWTVGLGAEIPLNQDVGGTSQSEKGWLLRIEGAHIKLEEKDYIIKQSGMEGETNVMSVFLIRRF